jgi:HEAT repeat protein
MSIFGMFGPPNVEKLKAKNDLQGLIKALSYEADSNIRLAAATALKDCKGNKVTASLVKALKDKNMNVRAKAAETLEQMEWEPQSSSDQVAFLLATCMWDELQKSSQAAVPSLVAALIDENADIRKNAAATLITIGVPAVEDLIEALKSEANNSKGAKVGAFFYLSPTKAGMEYPATSENEDVRWTLIAILHGIGTPAVDPLIKMIGSENVDIKHHASWALVEIGEPALSSLLSYFLPKSSGGAFNTTELATIAMIAKSEKQRTGKSIVSYYQQYQGEANLKIMELLATSSEESVEFRNWVDGWTKEEPTEPEPTLSISLWSADEQTLRQMQSDKYFLTGILMQDSNSASKRFIEALNQGCVLSFDISQNSSKGGYDVKITLTSKQNAG